MSKKMPWLSVLFLLMALTLSACMPKLGPGNHQLYSSPERALVGDTTDGTILLESEGYFTNPLKDRGDIVEVHISSRAKGAENPPVFYAKLEGAAVTVNTAPSDETGGGEGQPNTVPNVMKAFNDNVPYMFLIVFGISAYLAYKVIYRARPALGVISTYVISLTSQTDSQGTELDEIKVNVFYKPPQNAAQVAQLDAYGSVENALTTWSNTIGAFTTRHSGDAEYSDLKRVLNELFADPVKNGLKLPATGLVLVDIVVAKINLPPTIQGLGAENKKAKTRGKNFKAFCEESGLTGIPAILAWAASMLQEGDASLITINNDRKGDN